MAPTPLEAWDEYLVQQVARAICAKTNVARAGEADVIFDSPDDLYWDDSMGDPRPLPRWRLYEDRALAALQAAHVVEVRHALRSILRQVKRGQDAVPVVIERSFHDIENLARRALSQLDSSRE